MDERFNYSVNPRKRIISEFNILKNVRTPKTLMLTKAEVIDALKYCLVYRRFDAQTIKKVNLMNLNRMHQAEYDPTLEQEITPIEIDTAKEETPIMESTSVVFKEEVAEDPVEKELATAPVEEIIEELTPPEVIKQVSQPAVYTEVVEAPAVEEPLEEVSEIVEESIPDVIEPTVEFEENKDNTQNNKKYNNNKKHH